MNQPPRFQLIVAIITIAQAVRQQIASFYFGGPAFSRIEGTPAGPGFCLIPPIDHRRS